MKILLVHQNYPAQFLRLAPQLAARGHEVRAMTTETNHRKTSIPTVRYKTPPAIEIKNSPGTAYATHATRGIMAGRGARALRDRHGYTPDVIFGHSGWGETLYLKEVWPEAKLLVYAELLYQSRGADVGFDAEFTGNLEDAQWGTVGRSAHLIQAIVQADAAMAPTQYQADSFPPELRQKITVIHDGIDTSAVRPDPNARLTLPGIPEMAAGDEVLTYVSRSLEPYRGFHVAMRALPQILAARPNARVVMVGGDGVSYGYAPKDAESWKAKMLAELGERIDLSRVHFPGRLMYPDYIKLLQVSRAHLYLTYPFVLSWSLTESMAAGCQVIGSDTGPVRELIRDGVNGRLVPFFDIDAIAATTIRALAPNPDAARLGAAARATILDGYDFQTQCLPKLVAWVESHGPQG